MSYATQTTFLAALLGVASTLPLQAQTQNPLAPAPSQNPLAPQNPPAAADNPLAQPVPANVSPAAPANNAAGGPLTLEQIGDALDPYGKNTLTNNGHTQYSITVHRGTWNLNIIINLSPNGRVIWLTNSLTRMPDPAHTSVQALMDVLAKNTEIGPLFFSIANGGLILSDPIANAYLTPDGFRARVEAMVNTILDTAPLWNQNTLAGNAPPPAAPAPAGEGNPLAK
jgi:hypothetical protein